MTTVTENHRECSGCWSHGERVYLDAGIMNGEWLARAPLRHKDPSRGNWGVGMRGSQETETGGSLDLLRVWV